MSNEKVPNIDDNNIIWKEFESKQGKKYLVGYPETDNSDEKKTENKLTKSEFSIDVYWPVSDSGEWIPTSSEVIKTTGITRYELNQQPSYKAYKYALWFSNTETYDYFFVDETGDFYEVNTYLNRVHFVQYNSEKPNIVHIRGN